MLSREEKGMSYEGEKTENKGHKRDLSRTRSLNKIKKRQRRQKKKCYEGQ